MTALQTASLDSIEVYPNPATNFITIKSNGAEIQQVTISDLSGKIMIDKLYEGFDNFTVNVSYLPEEVYVMQIKTEKEIKTIKFVKQ